MIPWILMKRMNDWRRHCCNMGIGVYEQGMERAARSGPCIDIGNFRETFCYLTPFFWQNSPYFLSTFMIWVTSQSLRNDMMAAGTARPCSYS